jgi:hypothetical protein
MLISVFSICICIPFGDFIFRYFFPFGEIYPFGEIFSYEYFIPFRLSVLCPFRGFSLLIFLTFRNLTLSVIPLGYISLLGEFPFNGYFPFE